METTLYEFKVRAADGKDFDFEALRGRPVLVVNTASKCGFTPQYAGLETLHQKFKDRGLAVIAAPCDQFAHQEPGGDEEVVRFCRRNFGVTFPILSKAEVNGPGAHPLFVWLRRKTRGLLGDRIRWNFTKFLVSRDGTTVRRYSPATAPEALEGDIRAALAE
jgi:glutathione peroxidase